MAEKLIVLDPTLEVEIAPVECAPRTGEIRILGLLDNGKPNSDILLHKVAARLREQYSDLQVKYYCKPSAYRPAPAALLDQVVAECDSVLVGIGD
ncbi:MAG: UGSC family (seleno)protein [Ktedonobacteraceae bacterium]